MVGVDATFRFNHLGFHVGVDASKGRGLYCNRAFATGEAVLHNTAFSSLGSCESWLHRCMVCFVPKEDLPQGLQTCTGCRVMAFCSKECAAADLWHHKECRALPQLMKLCPANAMSNLSSLILAARALRVVEGVEDYPHPNQLGHGAELFSPEGRPSDLQNMMHHEDLEGRAQRHLLAKLLFVADKEGLLLPSALRKRYNLDAAAACIDVEHCMLKMQFNNFRMSDNAFVSVAEVCDPVMALLNHSCEPNVVIVWNCPSIPGDQVSHTVRCIQPLQAGSELLISYVDTRRPWWIRQAATQSAYNFACNCPVCQDITEYRNKHRKKRCKRSLPLPRGVLASVGSVANSSGLVMEQTIPDNDVKHILQVEMGLSIAPDINNENQAMWGAGGILGRQTSGAVHMLSPKEARRRLDMLVIPSKTLQSLLGPQNMLLRELRKVMVLADRCGDWVECISLAPVVLMALGEGLSAMRIDVIALEAKAKSNQWIECGNQCSNEKCAEAVAACDEALAGIRLLHGPFASRLARTSQLQHLLEILQGKRNLQKLLHIKLDELD